jgi:VWFA-related protein
MPRKFITAIFLIASTALAQTPVEQSKEPASTSTTIVSRSELVYVPVIVTGRDGKAIKGLPKEAFIVEQDGNPQPISVFEEVANPSTSIIPTPSTPGFATNYAAPDQNARRLTIVVLDALNTPYMNQSRAREALIKYLSAALPANEPVAVLGLGRNGLRQLHGFTTNPQRLAEALQKVKLAPANAENTSAGEKAASDLQSQIDSSGDPTETSILQFFLELERTVNTFNQQQAIRTTLLSLQQIAGAFEGVPGRKTMIWATAGFPFMLDDPLSFQHMGTDMSYLYTKTWRSLSNSSIAVYPVDVNGLGASGMTSVASLSDASRGMSATGIRHEAPMMMGQDRSMQQQVTLRAFANATGGKAFMNTNDFSAAFREASNDSSAYYVLGYYLQGERKIGWHKLKVKVAAPHAEVRARQGFFFGQPQGDAVKQLREEFVTALGSPLDYTGVHFSTRLIALPRKPGSDKYTLQVENVIPEGAVLIDAAQNNLLHFDIAIMAVGPGDKYAGDASNTVRANLTPESMAKIKQTGITYRDRLTLAPGEYEIRVGVRDNQTGKVGSVRTSITLTK